MPKFRWPRIRRVPIGTLIREKDTGDMWFVQEHDDRNPYSYVTKNIANGYVRRCMDRSEFVVPTKPRKEKSS